MNIDPNDKDIYIEKNFFSQNIPPEGRAYVLDKLFFNFQGKWKISFWLMLALSTGIASLGLSEDSAAVVIGAMVIAPLGQPMIALGGSIALGWRREAFRMIGIIIVGTLTTIVIGFLFGMILTVATPTHEILLRTSPDLRDMGIALFAGAAGAYGYYRQEYSTVLAGVAIAVALIPPLCACGLMLEQGHYILAKGSILLFCTNLIGIAFSSILVFFLLGLKHKRDRKWFYAGTVIVVIAGLSILSPLVLNYKHFASETKFQSETYNKTALVLNQAKGSPVIKNISIQGNAAIISIEPFPDNDAEITRLTNELQQATGLQVILQKNN